MKGRKPFFFMMQWIAVVVVIILLYFLLKPKKSQRLPAIYISSIGKKLFLSTHSYQRLKEREISFKELKEMLESEKSKASVQKNGRIKVTNDHITAILGMSAGDLVLITVFKNSQNGKKRH